MIGEYSYIGAIAICLILEGVVLLFFPTHQLGGEIALLAGILLFVGIALAVLKNQVKRRRFSPSHKK